MGKYKIVHNECECSYTLCDFKREEEGKDILIFKAKSWEEASFIKNQFLHFEPYKPFDDFWIAKIGHKILIDKKQKSKENYEIRTLIVLAEDEKEAIKKLKKEAKKYSKPYKNIYKEKVSWQFDEIISLEKADFFDTIELYRGLPVELDSKVITKKKKLNKK